MAKVEKGVKVEGITRTVKPPNNHQNISDRDKRVYYISHGAIHKILTNPIYIGKIKYKDIIFYDGRHQAIVDHELWQRVQDTLPLRSMKANKSSIRYFYRTLFKTLAWRTF